MRHTLAASIIAIALAALAIALVPDHLAGFAYTAGKIALFVTCVSLVDNVLLGSFDTAAELRGRPGSFKLSGSTSELGQDSGKSPNVAYAIYLASIHVGLALCIFQL